MNKDKVILSADGSNTIVSDIFGVSYHSIHGALEESIHIFISAGLYYQFSKGLKKIRIFEMGFGSGLNAWLSLIEAEKLNVEIEYVGVELYPLSKEISNALNFKELLPNLSSFEQSSFDQLHDLSWNENHQITKYFNFKKLNQDILSFNFPADHYNLIYFDAFAPSAQSLLWEKELHRKIYKSMSKGACLVTYCAKGIFKRMLKSLSYQIDVLNGPARKHEMTRAVK